MISEFIAHGKNTDFDFVQIKYLIRFYLNIIFNKTINNTHYVIQSITPWQLAKQGNKK